MVLRKSWLILSPALLFLAAAQARAPSYTIEYSIVGAGSVTLEPDKPSYQKNNIVTITATPDADWRFDHWEGDLTGEQNPATIRVGQNYSVIAVFSELSGGTNPPPPPRPRAVRDQGLIVGYFVQWGIYRRNYMPRDIVESGTAERIDVVNYAFAGIDENVDCVSLDEFADFEKRFDSSETVDGIADTVTQALKGNFNQLRKLNQLYPHIRVMLSIGGWTESARFSDAALPENRAAFVASCIDKFIHGNIAPGVNAAGVFDGLDIDWEYPGRCGATCSFRAEDSANFTGLLAEFRNQLDDAEDEIESQTGFRPELLSTIAAPASAYNSEPIEIDLIHQYLDWINVMAYDFHGSWESSGPTNHQAHLRQGACDSADAEWGEKALSIYLDAGVPPSKLLLGVPFYGRGWRGVVAVDDGLCQTARGVPRGTYEKGVGDYAVLAVAAKPDFYDQTAAAHWTFDGQEFWTFDDPATLRWKAQ